MTSPQRLAPLARVYQPGRFGHIDKAPGVTIAERRALSIVQVAAWAEGAAAAVAGTQKVAGVAPSRENGVALHAGDTAAIWVGPDRWLIVEPEKRRLYKDLRGAIGENDAAVTDQSHSRCVLRISGPRARDVLRKGTMIDLDPDHFRAGQSRGTALFHMSAVIHCVEADSFDIYVFRSFGESFFAVLTHAAAEYGYEVVG